MRTEKPREDVMMVMTNAFPVAKIEFKARILVRLEFNRELENWYNTQG